MALLCEDALNGIGLFLNFSGAVVLWFYTYALETDITRGSASETDRHGRNKQERNAWRQHWQNIGILLIAIGFLIQFVGVFI
jgi:hypothetical protein